MTFPKSKRESQFYRPYDDNWKLTYTQTSPSGPAFTVPRPSGRATSANTSVNPSRSFNAPQKAPSIRPVPVINPTGIKTQPSSTPGPTDQEKGKAGRDKEEKPETATRPLTDVPRTVTKSEDVGQVVEPILEPVIICKIHQTRPHLHRDDDLDTGPANPVQGSRTNYGHRTSTDLSETTRQPSSYSINDTRDGSDCEKGKPVTEVRPVMPPQDTCPLEAEIVPISNPVSTAVHGEKNRTKKKDKYIKKKHSRMYYRRIADKNAPENGEIVKTKSRRSSRRGEVELKKMPVVGRIRVYLPRTKYRRTR
ncbi:hypothetical protein BJY04DRAFT_120312 [Aspergillus karnatakaensis]|uniref:uncharacterized protein n=1 Tax=Aspergillus karnatakaensis TaxID=1810916 RepID=UPI003CCCBBCF